MLHIIFINKLYNDEIITLEVYITKYRIELLLQVFRYTLTLINVLNVIGFMTLILFT